MLFEELVRSVWRARQRSMSRATFDDYDRTFRRFGAWLAARDVAEVAGISGELVEDYLNGLAMSGLKAKTIANHWIALSSLWTFGASRHGLAHVIRGRVECPTIKRQQPVPYSADEVRRMLRACDCSAAWRDRPETASRRPTALRDRAIIVTLIDTGIRASELCDLSMGDYDSQRQELAVRSGKGGKGRILPLGVHACDAIDEYLEARRRGTGPKQRRRQVEIGLEDALFVTAKGTHLERWELLRMVAAAAARAEPPVQGANIHRFRHTFAINYLRRHPNVYTLQRVLGHSSLDTVKLYLEVSQVDIKEAHRVASVADAWRL